MTSPFMIRNLHPDPRGIPVYCFLQDTDKYSEQQHHVYFSSLLKKQHINSALFAICVLLLYLSCRIYSWFMSHSLKVQLVIY